MDHHGVAWQAPDPHDPPGPQTSHHQEPGILRLRPSLRALIYEFIGVRGPTASELADEGGGRIFNLNGPRRLEQPQIGFYGLLVSCRVLYRELSRLLYATNHFTIRFSDRRSLEPLRNLRSPTCASLAHLKVILAETSCHFTGPTSDGDWVYGMPCCKRQYAPHCISGENHRHDDPIGGLDPRLAEWDRTISYLASAIGVGILDLAVVCDVCHEPTGSGIQAARSVTMSLLRLPRLKDCSIRLCHEPDQQLQQLAHETVLRARHVIPPSSPWAPSLVEQPSSNSPPQLLRLPPELRLRILQYTDLITPWAEVRWSLQHQGFIVGTTHCANQEFMGETCPPSRHFGCQFHRCDLTFPRPSPGCFCRKRHSASSSTVACKCWTSPQALFLVCKTLYKDAQAVFYSGNRFVVFDRHSDPPWNREVERDSLVGDNEGYPYPRLGASIFLRERVPKDCLHHLRFLELVFPAWDHDVWPTEGQGVLQDWKDTLEWARDKLNVGGLTVRLIAMDASDWEQPLSRMNMTREQGIQVIAGYMRLLGPLVCLGDLRRFYAQLVSPWRWNEGGRGSTKAVAAMERMLKERAERMLMGERYMPLNSGYKEPADSVWHYQYERNA
ncbi:hypothetical protein VM1G_11165 [Cytospora mali]|uniref:Uncharacterized protein n=1 Tax=Cytospora mali TaxID=578113 RepID=A0A194VK24_CYTMA|nr:hypothetical protein VM1G_11165 [Valsa mali]